MASANGCTGDVRNNLAKLLREIQRMKLTVEPNIHGLSLGIPSAFLPIIHCALMQYSVPLANWLASRDYELYAKNDFRFVEGVYKVMRDVFYYHPRLSMSQFLDVGFAERKIIMTTDILRYCQAKHRELMGKPPQSRTRRKLYPAVTSGSIAGVGIHPMPKAYIEDCRTTSACSERQPAMVDYRTTFHSASSSPDPAPRSLSVSPIEGLGSSAHSSPCKDSAPHIIHPSLNPSLFSSRLADTVPVSHLSKNDHSLPPKADHSHPPKVDHSHQTHEPSKMERLVIRHRDDGKVAKETGLPVHRQEEVAQGNVMASLAFLPKGLDKEAREKHGDDVESVASWQSLPLHEEQGVNGRQDGEHDKDVNQRPSSSCVS